MTLRALLVAGILVGSAVAQDDQGAITATDKLVDSIKACPARVRIAQFKKEWVKETWGPPTQVKYDINRTASILNPFTATVDFSLTMQYGKHRKTREEAEADTDLKPLLIGRYRNTYKITKDNNLVLESTLTNDVSSGDWVPRPHWADACWDELR